MSQRKRNLYRRRQAILRRRRRLARERRGVLLLVVLSMLVLFMMIGTAFLLTSDQYRTSAKASAKLDRVGNHPTNLLERALYQVLRDTENPYSAVRYHSLLRDMYGTDGFVARVLRPATPNPNSPDNLLARYAAASPENTGTPDLEQLGPTRGQLVDIYLQPEAYDEDNSSLPPPDSRHVVKLERVITEAQRNAQPETVVHPLPRTHGYYNGCVLTMTSGPARGMSTRIVDYRYLGEGAGAGLWRLRVMAFPRADGSPLAVRAQGSRDPLNVQRHPEIADLVSDALEFDDVNPNGRIDEGELRGHEFIVNGRPFNGTGVGYNAMANPTAPRLTALEAVQHGSRNEWTAEELALLPNSVYIQLSNIVATPTAADLFSGDPLPRTFFNNLGLNGFPQFNTNVPPRYPTVPGPGGADESYDAPDFQNLALAMQTVAPRARGRVVQDNLPNEPLDPDDPRVAPNNFLRLDVEDVPLPSFHRPALFNYWFHRMIAAEWFQKGIGGDDPVLAVLQPWGRNCIPENGANDDNVPNNEFGARIVALKRKISLRPLAEDHPNFNGSNPLSRYRDTRAPEDAKPLMSRTRHITFPFWEAVGPWDVDNDNDGIRDSNWVDLGDPVQQAEDGTLYKPLYAFLIVDMDGKLNVNAHGTAEHIRPLDPSGRPTPDFDPLDNALAGSVSSDTLPHGIGWGPADVSLRPVFPTPTNPANTGRRLEEDGFQLDDYATLLVGRTAADGLDIAGRYGFIDVMTNMEQATAGRNYSYDPIAVNKPGRPRQYVLDTAPLDPLAALKFYGHPTTWATVDDVNVTIFDVPVELTKFANPPDFFSRYSLAMDHKGQPLLESFIDASPNANNIRHTLLVNSPYEVDLMSDSRRDSWSLDLDPLDAFNVSLELDDDATFAVGDLERLLRAHDADVGTLASRLWDVTNAFDPIKILLNEGITGPTPLELSNAQQQAAVNRRLVTTDSYDPPVPNEVVASRLAFGADGLPGVPQVDDDGNGEVDDASELNMGNFDPTDIANSTDDYFVIMGREAPANGRLLDLLRYRVTLELRRKNAISAGVRTPLTPADEALVNRVIFGPGQNDPTRPVPDRTATFPLIPVPGALQTRGPLLSPDVLAGLRMDVNRPFGNGRDDNFNGVVDEPWESLFPDPPFLAEPFLDLDRDGVRDGIEPFANLDGEPGPHVDLEAANLFGNPDLGVVRAVQDVWTQSAADIAAGRPVAYPNIDFTPMDCDSNGVISQKDHLLQRQLYARHLYVMMMLLVDQNFQFAQEEENQSLLDDGDPNFNATVELLKEQLNNQTSPPANVDAEARRIALRKLTAKRIAQWAVNCVDFRDSDAIMTPFEYDENPFDGWNTTKTGRGGWSLPLDGDIRTNENFGPDGAPGDGESDLSALGKGDDARIEEQTRGVVWGAERPELLITETLAFHDRRATDEDATGATQNDTSIFDSEEPDEDLDQRLKPQGSVFIEIYNPWASDSQLPGDLYSMVDGNGIGTPTPGVPLNRLSNAANPDNGLRSPVWRLAVVDDPKNGRLTGLNFRLLDPNGPGFDADKDAERWVYFTTGPPGDRPDGTVDLHIPPEPTVRLLDPTTNQVREFPTAKRYVIARREQRFGQRPNGPRRDVEIAPILPGRYAVIGSSGMQEKETNGLRRFITTLGRLHLDIADDEIDDRATWRERNPDGNLNRTRRIELIPSTNLAQQQLLVAGNGGPEVVRVNGAFVNVYDSDLNGESDPPPADPNQPDNRLIDPCVAIPIEDLSISEPVEGYPSLEYRRLYRENPNEDGSPLANRVLRVNAHGELEFQNQQGNAFPYDRPLDTEFELVRNGTVHNYRSIHLQRLANPMMPWNPEPFDGEGMANDEYDQRLPINPYVTIDSSSTDLTAFNGASVFERTELPTRDAEGDSGPIDAEQRNLMQVNVRTPVPYPAPGTEEYNEVADEQELPTETRDRQKLESVGQWHWHKLQRFLPDDEQVRIRSAGVQDRQGAVANDGVLFEAFQFKQRLNLKSLERGAHFRAYDPTDIVWKLQPSWQPRVLWRPERPSGTAFDEIDGKLLKVTDLVNVFPRQFLIGETNNNMTPDETDRANFLKDEMGMQGNARRHVVDFVLEHTLGFVNESYAPVVDYTNQPDDSALQIGGVPSTPVQARGTPQVNTDPQLARPDSNESYISFREEIQRREMILASTFPWLAWNNRPYANHLELLQVPATSQTEMLRQFSIVNATTANPYDGDGFEDPVNQTLEENAERVQRQRAPYGHLLNFLQTASRPAEMRTDPSGVERNVGAPHFYRVLDYLHVPSRFVNTDVLLNPPTFAASLEDPNDPRFALRPPFNLVSRYREPGKVNLNTITGRRLPADTSLGSPPQVWSEVFDGLMHRHRDGERYRASATNTLVTSTPANLRGSTGLLTHEPSHFGPAWRDVALSRRGYAQVDSQGNSVDKINVPGVSNAPDTHAFGLNKDYPSFFANPFRSPEAGNLVPLPQLVQLGVNASRLRAHPYTKGENGSWGVSVAELRQAGQPRQNADDDLSYAGNIFTPDRRIDDTREAGFADDEQLMPQPIDPNESSGIPLFSESWPEPHINAERSSYLLYQPMSRLANLTTTRSNVYAIWITVGFFEVERAPEYDDDIHGPDRTLYDRIYPEGYALGRELGIDVGDVRRHRAFYIVDRTLPVAFKPGEDLNIEQMIRLRRRIE